MSELEGILLVLVLGSDNSIDMVVYMRSELLLNSTKMMRSSFL